MKLEPVECYTKEAVYRAVFESNFDLVPFIPYIRTQTKTLIYEPQSMLIFKWGSLNTKKNYQVALRNKEIKIGLVEDRTERQKIGEELLEFLTQLISKKETLSPSCEPVKRPPVLEIYKHLPKTNCKACGEETCLAFATKLNLLEVELENCPEILKNIENL